MKAKHLINSKLSGIRQVADFHYLNSMIQMSAVEMGIIIKLSTFELPYKPALNQFPDKKIHVNFYAHEIC